MDVLDLVLGFPQTGVEWEPELPKQAYGEHEPPYGRGKGAVDLDHS